MLKEEGESIAINSMCESKGRQEKTIAQMEGKDSNMRCHCIIVCMLFVSMLRIRDLEMERMYVSRLD